MTPLGAIAGALARSGVGVLTTLASAIGNGVGAYGSRQARQWRLRKATRADLLLALLAARLSAVAYLASHAEVRDALRAPELSDVPGGLELVYFKRQAADTNELHPQWFLARGEAPSWLQARAGSRRAHGAEPTAPQALYLVFRGTWSKLDLIRDLCVEPVAYQGRMYHGGFLSGVRDDRELHRQLRRALDTALEGGCEHLFVFGHSLGGSLGFSLVAAGLLPPSYKGAVSAVGVGSPPVLLADDDERAAGGEQEQEEEEEAAAAAAGSGAGAAAGGVDAGRGDEDATAAAPRYLLVVNDCDVVPRLLGSPMPVGTLAMLAAMPQGGGSLGPKVLQRNLELMQTMERYTHAPRTDTLLLRDCHATLVPAIDRAAVLHLHEALSPSLIHHHTLHGDKESYIGGLEVAAALAELDDDDEDDAFGAVPPARSRSAEEDTV